MSFHMTFYHYDHDVLSMGIGSGDSSIKAAVDDEFSRRTLRRDAVDPEWDAARRLVHQVIDKGFPDRCRKETLRHRLAAEWLTTIFRIPGNCEAQDWRWSVFYDTLHTVPGFSDPIPDIVNALDDGRPFFGDTCPDEAHYGHLTQEECQRFLRECTRHRPGFEADGGARECVSDLIRLFEFAVDGKCDLWFGFG